MRLGLRWQILLSLIVLMVATVVLISLAMLGLTQRNMEAQAELGAERVARIAATTVSSAIDPATALDSERNLANIERLCALFSRQFDATRMAVVAPPDGGGLRLLASYPRGSIDAVADVEFLVARATGEVLSQVQTRADGVRQVDVFAPIEREGQVVAVLRLEVPLGDVQRLVSASQQLILLYIGLDALFIVVFGYFVLTRLIVRPLFAISAATERVAAGDLQTTVEVRSTNEIGALADNFDRMVARLRDGRDDLERRVDELDRSRKELERTQAELVFSEKMASVGGLAAGIAHEVGNPLAAVVGLLELLRDRDGLDDEDIDDLLGRVDREIGRINTIIADLLDYARVSDAAPEPVDVAVPVASAVSLVGHHPRGRRVDVQVDGGPAALVMANENRLVQVFLNLLLNAADACSGVGGAGGDGPGVVRVSWAAETVDGEAGVRVDVRDSGPGIPADVLPQIFEPFFTTKPTGEGTGLGLAMSQRIVGAYRGRISAESYDDGAVFHVWLPAVPTGAE